MSHHHPRVRRMLLAGLAFGLAAATSTGLYGTADAKPPKPPAHSKPPAHPASEGWHKINGTWVQGLAEKPHVMLNAAKFAARQKALAAEKAAWAKKHPITTHNNYDLQMTYRGGQDDIGVTTGPPKVYLVYWGSQWGAQGTDPATGDITLSGDVNHAAPYQQDFFKGLGSNGDTWSKATTQYCEDIQSGTTRCPAGTTDHVGFPVAGRTLAGVWVDSSAAAPQAANEPQIAAEVLAAAQHFGNTQATQNRNVQYIINTPQGADSDKWHELGYCAWHTFERSSYGTLAYTLMPYLTDVPACGTNWINPGPRGVLDGYGIIGGHEYAETITDQNASGAWTDATGQEIGDKCAWIPKGENGGLFNITYSTGVFPMQTLWSNWDHLCTGDGTGTAPLFSNKPLLVTQPSNRTATVGRPVDYPVLASDTASSAITYSATGLPSGLVINRTTGHITGTTQAQGWKGVTVTASDDKGNTASRFFWYGFFPGPQYGPSPIEQLNDPGFENGTFDHAPWNPSDYNIITPSSAHAPHSGSGYAWLGQNTTTDDSITQWVEMTPGYSRAYLSFWLNIEGAAGGPAPTGGSYDTLSLVLYDQWSGNVITTLRTWSNLDSAGGYQQQNFDLTPYVPRGFGPTMGIKLVSHSTTGQTAFLIDDASVKLY